MSNKTPWKHKIILFQKMDPKEREEIFDHFPILEGGLHTTPITREDIRVGSMLLFVIRSKPIMANTEQIQINNIGEYDLTAHIIMSMVQKPAYWESRSDFYRMLTNMFLYEDSPHGFNHFMYTFAKAW
jgi:hypothetical protein